MAGGQFFACCLVVLVRAVYVYGSGLWNDPHLVNFAASWIPAIVSVIVGILPEKDWAKMRIRHRLLIIVIGVSWSSVLWHQQAITDKANTETNTKLLSDAVKQANVHSDEKFAGVKTDVGNLGKQVEGVGKKTEALGGALAKATGDITAGLGKVGKPDPPEQANLQFSLWRDGGIKDSEFPLETEHVSQGTDGNYSVSLVVKNISNVAANSLDVWVHLCSTCTFVKEPDGFEKPTGIAEGSRHAFAGDLNSGVTWRATTITFTPPNPPTNQAGIAFSWTCKNCGKMKQTKDLILTLDPRQITQQ